MPNVLTENRKTSCRKYHTKHGPQPKSKTSETESDTEGHQGVAEYVTAFKNSRRLGRQVVFHHVSPARQPIHEKTTRPLAPVTESMLRANGINGLYLHQAKAIDAVRDGRNVVIATSTASGKSLIYNIPVIEEIVENPCSTALYLFPLKALANDQMASFCRMSALAGPDTITCGIYDGDTTQWQRKKMRQRPPNVLFTNPEMLHLSLLPYHSTWKAFIENLKFIVVDEVHTYRGLLGSHMAWVFRRLRRICHRYGADPTFIFCSATVGNPGELASDLTGLKVVSITESGAPCGKRHFLMVDPEDGGAAQMAVQLLMAALHRGLRTIVYTQSRKLTELVNLWCMERAVQFRDRISAYRAGFLPEERRQIEKRMSNGSLLAVISTSALELGIDVGVLDLCILVGYPGTVMSTRQRGGRVGRSMRESAVVLIAQEDALDHYFLNHPQELIQRKPEAAVINPLNTVIAERHLLCAAAEMPLKTEGDPACPKEMMPVVDRLVDQTKLLKSADGKTIFATRTYPHRDVNLRGTGRSYQIIVKDTGELIGSVDAYRAMRETHPGAVYLHRGDSWLVKSLDIEAQTVIVEPARVNYFTRVTATKDTEIMETLHTRQVGSTVFSIGRLRVTDQVTGYEQRLIRGQKLINRVSLDLPSHVFETEGMWFTIPDHIRERVESEAMHFMGGIHALEHAMIGILPLYVLTDRNDLSGISFTMHPQCATAAVFIYDSVPGGIGLARTAFKKARKVMEQVIRTIKACPCENGCPSCVHSPRCGSGNRPIDKEAALFTAQALMSKERNRQESRPAVTTYQVGNSAPQAPQGPRKGNNRLESSQAGIAKAGKTRTGRCGRLPDDYVVIDVETQLSASEAGGWHMAHRMKVSCAVLYSSRDDSFRTFFEHQLDSLFERLSKTRMVTGFNINRFDYKVLSAYTSMDLHALPTLDLLEEVYNKLGYRISLDGLAKATLGIKKSGNGLLALKWWKQGKLEQIAHYCRKDVEITRDLLLFAAKNRYLLFTNKAGKKVRVPVDI